ncbi:MAG TPA: alpha/beta fold hydrolase [Rubricoccaceae bacterium]|nr:alpha/beta fold hydrolase [Rubricoccaceae bacterium]
MPHVTFIHGLANKPAAEALLRSWEHGFAHPDGFDLGDHGVTTSMVYWADVLYAEPLPEASSTEAATSEEEAEALAAEAASAAGGWGDLDAEGRAFVERLGTKMGVEHSEASAEAPVEPEARGAYEALERIPLPWFIKRRVLRLLIRDAHHYLFNASSSPRPGDTYAVQEELRRRFVAALKEGAERTEGGPHVVVSHSMGTIVAYDCLVRVPECPAVDAVVTIGSPLGLDEVQDRLRPEGAGQPGWSREDGFPSPDKLRGPWVNVYDPLDVVCALDPRLANDYRRGGRPAIDDLEVSNEGSWRHGFLNYARRGVVRDRLRALLGL